MKRSERDREKLEQKEGYARSALCRWRVLRQYFSGGAADFENCWVCDNCRKGLAGLAEQPVAQLESEADDEPASDSSGGFARRVAS